MQAMHQYRGVNKLGPGNKEQYAVIDLLRPTKDYGPNTKNRPLGSIFVLTVHVQANYFTR